MFLHWKVVSAAISIVNMTVTPASTRVSLSDRRHAGEAVDAVIQMYHRDCGGE